MAKKVLSCRSSSYEPKELLWQSKKQIFPGVWWAANKWFDSFILANSHFQQTEIMAHPGSLSDFSWRKHYGPEVIKSLMKSHLPPFFLGRSTCKESKQIKALFCLLHRNARELFHMSILGLVFQILPWYLNNSQDQKQISNFLVWCFTWATENTG